MSHATPSLPAAVLQLHQTLGVPPDYSALHQLPFHPEADESQLVEIARNDEDRPIRLIAPAAAAWVAMRTAATADGLELNAISGFRSFARQTEIIRGKFAAGETSHVIFRYVAAPGFSEHHSGRALDIASPEHIELDADFARTAAYVWLIQHAANFGFRLSYPENGGSGIGFEPWHWCWQG